MDANDAVGVNARAPESDTGACAGAGRQVPSSAGGRRSLQAFIAIDEAGLPVEQIGAYDPADVNAKHLQTAHLLQTLPAQAVSSGLITAAAQGIGFFLNLLSAVVLARLLHPVEFGLVGMVSVVTAFLGMLKEAGLSTVTVQRETITQGQVSNLFWINVALGTVMGLIGVALARPVAWFYGDVRLVPITVALSATFLLTGLTVQHQALLTRQMRFLALASIEIASVFVGVVAGCCLALFSFGYWSLVAMQLARAAAALVMTWWMSGWRPDLPGVQSQIAPLLRFGMHLTLSDLLARLAVRVDSVLIGRFFGAEALGLYSRAGILLARPLEQLLAPASAVLIPVLSRLQNDPARYRQTFMRAYDTLAIVTFPFTAMCLALSEPLVVVLLGPAWRSAAPLFAGHTIAALSLPLTFMASWLLTSQGRGRELLHLSVVISIVMVLSYVIGLPWGPRGVVLAYSASNFLIRLPILYLLVGRNGPVRSLDLCSGFFSHLPCWGIVFAATTLARLLVVDTGPLVQLAVGGAAGLAASMTAILMLTRPRQAAFYAVRAVRTSLSRRWPLRSAVPVMASE